MAVNCSHGETGIAQRCLGHSDAEEEGLHGCTSPTSVVTRHQSKPRASHHPASAVRATGKNECSAPRQRPFLPHAFRQDLCPGPRLRWTGCVGKRPPVAATALLRVVFPCRIDPFVSSRVDGAGLAQPLRSSAGRPRRNAFAASRPSTRRWSVLNLDVRAEHRQSQTLSPRLQHAVRLLQMSSLDFAAMVRDTLGKNPFLESDDDSDDASGAAPANTLPTTATIAISGKPTAAPGCGMPRTASCRHWRRWRSRRR